MPSRYDYKFQKKLKKIQEKTLKKKLLREAKEKVEFSKILCATVMIAIAINGFYIEQESILLMKMFGDLTPLNALISASVMTPIAEILALTVYCIKAFFAKKYEEENKLRRGDYNEINQ